MICSNDRLAAQDRRMASLYYDVLASSPAISAASSSAAATRS
jgi:uncharacterized protein